MQAFWNDIHTRYDFDLGKISLSPLLSASTGLILDYIAALKQGRVSAPFCLCFPDKFQASTWLSLFILRNYFREDYLLQANNRVSELKLTGGDNIEIFGSIAKYLGQYGNRIQLSFLDVTRYDASIKISSQINPTRKNKLNSIDHFKRSKRKSQENRSAISKILEPKDEVVVNPGLLESTVLLVTGRGNVSKVRESLMKTSVLGESLAKAFGLDTNLQLTPDLELYKNHFESNIDYRNGVFRELFTTCSEQLLSPNSTFPLQEELALLKELAANDLNSEAFSDQFQSMLDELEKDEYPILFNLFERYPGIVTPLRTHLRAVVINDLTIFDDYKKTIEQLTQRFIPVIAICDKAIRRKEDFGFYSNFARKFPEAIRLDWTKAKISALRKFAHGQHFLDQEMWHQSEKYSEQQIDLIIATSHPLDPLLPRVQKLICKMEGYEKVKRAYWNYLYPAIYAIKNDSITQKDIVHSLLNHFLSEIQDTRIFLRADANELIDLCIKTAQQSISSNKTVGSSSSVFRQFICSIDGKDVFIPSNPESKYINQATDSTQEIVFLGFPLNEPFNQYLSDAVTQSFVPRIVVHSWPTESAFVYQYLHKRLRAGYFEDSNLGPLGFPSELTTVGEAQVEDDLCKSLPKNNLGTNYNERDHEGAENILFDLSNARLTSYKQTSVGNSLAVKCNIVHFENGFFMFLPYSSRVLAQSESVTGEQKVKRSTFEDLHVGYKVFTFSLDTSSRRDILKRYLPSGETLDDLYIWRDRLESMYNGDLESLEQRLMQVKRKYSLRGNPTKQNIYRWLYDDEILSPDDVNLEVILQATQDQMPLSELKLIRNAYKVVNSLNRMISSRIKKFIMNKLNNLDEGNSTVFTIDLDDNRIEVNARRIVALQNDEYSVEYGDTRKFIC